MVAANTGWRLAYKGEVGSRLVWQVTGRNLAALVRQAPVIQRHRAAAILKENLRRVSPKKTGLLSRRWDVAFLPDGRIRLRNRQAYAEYQNTKTRNRNYIQRAIQNAMPAAFLVGKLHHRHTGNRVMGRKPPERRLNNLYPVKQGVVCLPLYLDLRLYRNKGH